YPVAAGGRPRHEPQVLPLEATQRLHAVVSRPEYVKTLDRATVARVVTHRVEPAKLPTDIVRLLPQLTPSPGFGRPSRVEATPGRYPHPGAAEPGLLLAFLEQRGAVGPEHKDRRDLTHVRGFIRGTLHASCPRGVPDRCDDRFREWRTGERGERPERF